MALAMASSSSSSATVAVEKATSDLLIGPDWTMNIDICDSVNSNIWQAKDVVKAVKKRLQHKNPKVQLLALTLLETMVKNCGDYVHFQIAEKNILGEMVKIVKKKADMHVRDKILILLDSWQEAFGGPGGKHSQYYWAYEELRRAGVVFPQRSPDAAPIFTPPVTHSTLRHAQAAYGMPSNSSRRLDETMAMEFEGLSLSGLDSMRSIVELLNDMLQAVNPDDREALKDEIIVDLVNRCRSNQKKLMQMLTTTGHSKPQSSPSESTYGTSEAIASTTTISTPVPCTALALPDPPAPVRTTKEQDIIDLLSITLSTPTSDHPHTPHTPTAATPSMPQVPASSTQGYPYISQTYPGNQGQSTYNNYIVPWAQPQPQHHLQIPSQPHLQPQIQQQMQPQPPLQFQSQSQPQPHTQPQLQFQPQSQSQPQSHPQPQQKSQSSSQSQQPWPHQQFQPQSQSQLQPQPQPQQQFQSPSQSQPQPQQQFQSPSQSQHPPPQQQFQPQPQSLPQPQPQQQFQSPSPSEHPWPQQQFQPQSQPLSQPQPQQQFQIHSQSQRPRPQQQFQSLSQPPLHTQHQQQFRPQSQPQPNAQSQLQYRPESQLQFQSQLQSQNSQYSSGYPPPPWAATPGYANGQSHMSATNNLFSTPRANAGTSYTPEQASRPMQHYNSYPTRGVNGLAMNGDPIVNSGPRNAAPPGQKPFIPSYRLFEDLNVLGNTDGRFKMTSSTSPSLSGPSSQGMVGGRK
ncbi:hypothetical protein MANES_09G114500v8 [Manihot esculenta]|uniref:Uncharacterized protein n=1 Tax=Manihot esculenta TaxID=3983 RepID=A0ACB7H6Y7_MANES|nr:hypothetical protein MANES_09G114500v8 [Manihot esculenta]